MPFYVGGTCTVRVPVPVVLYRYLVLVLHICATQYTEKFVIFRTNKTRTVRLKKGDRAMVRWYKRKNNSTNPSTWERYGDVKISETNGTTRVKVKYDDNGETVELMAYDTFLLFSR